MATGDRYTGNPLDPSGSFTFSDGQTIPASLEDAFGGAFRQIGTSIRDTQTGRIVMNLSTHGGYQVTELEGGRVMFGNIQSPDELNQYSGPTDQLTIGGTFDVSLPDGSQTTVTVDQVHVNRVGQQTVMRRSADEGWLPMNAKVQGNTNAALRRWVQKTYHLQMGENFRFATPEETASHSLWYAIGRGNRDLLRQLSDQFDLSDEGGESPESNALRFLMRQVSLDALTVTRSFILQPGG